MLACVCKAQEDLDKAPEARAREKERERESHPEACVRAG